MLCTLAGRASATSSRWRSARSPLSSRTSFCKTRAAPASQKAVPSSATRGHRNKTGSRQARHRRLLEDTRPCGMSQNGLSQNGMMMMMMTSGDEDDDGDNDGDDGHGNGISRKSQDEAGRVLRKKNCLLTLQHGPLSARRELQSHPLAGQAQACGRLTKGGRAGGPDGTYRDHRRFHRRKKSFSHVILALGAMLICSVSFHGTSSNCACRPCAPGRLHRTTKKKNACHPCTRAMQIHPKSVTTFLELYVSSLHRGPALLHNSICACHPCTRAMQKNSLDCSGKKKNAVQLRPGRRENRQQGPQWSPLRLAAGYCVKFVPLGEESRVPAFRPSQTPWAASLAVDAAVAHQEPLLLLHSSPLGFAPELWPWIWPLAPVALPSSSGKHTPSMGSSTPRRHTLTVLFHSTRQTLYFPRICVRSLDGSRSREPLGADDDMKAFREKSRSTRAEPQEQAAMSDCSRFKQTQ